MCDPVSITAAAVSVAGATASIYSANKQAAEQMQAIAQQRKYQAEEISAKAEQEIGERLRAARASAARARVAAGEAGVGGQSSDLVLQDIFGQTNQDLAVIQKQAFFSDRASMSATESSLAGVHRVSGLDAARQIAGAALSGYQAGGALGGGSGNPLADFRARRSPVQPVKITAKRIPVRG